MRRSTTQVVNRKMKSTSTFAGGSRRLTQRVSIVATTLVAASALIFIRPAFAETDPCPAANIYLIQQDAPLVEQDTPSVPDMGEDVSPPSYESDLAPAPVEPNYPQTGMAPQTETAPMFGESTSPNANGAFMIPPESRFAQPFVGQSLPASGLPELPPVGGAPRAGGLYGRVP
jgi:hypothetical protein